MECNNSKLANYLGWKACELGCSQNAQHKHSTKISDPHRTEKKHIATVPPVCFSQPLAKEETILRAKQHQRTSAGAEEKERAREGKREQLKENERE